MHIFDATVMPPRQVASIPLKDQPGWITFSIDGRFAYPSTGDIVDVKTRQIVAELKDEAGKPVQSEKLLEIDFQGNQPVLVGDQFGIVLQRGRLGWFDPPECKYSVNPSPARHFRDQMAILGHHGRRISLRVLFHAPAGPQSRNWHPSPLVRHRIPRHRNPFVPPRLSPSAPVRFARG